MTKSDDEVGVDGGVVGGGGCGDDHYLESSSPAHFVDQYHNWQM